MVSLVPASVVVIAFPFSDLSGAELRPAVVLMRASRDFSRNRADPHCGSSASHAEVACMTRSQREKKPS